MELLEVPKESCKEEDPLEEKLKSLEQEWSSFKQSSNQNHHLRRCSTVVKDDCFHQLVTNNVSPRHLMSSLQLQSNSSEFKGRRLFQEGEYFKRRRLFEEEEYSTVTNESCFNLVVQDKEGQPSSSSSSSSSSVNQVVEVETKFKVGRNIWLDLVFMALAMYMLISIISSKCYGDQGHVILLVPT